MKILAIIPARGGSKGIPCKNIKKVVGKPLIEYTIHAAKDSKKLDRIIVSTDSPQIAKIAISVGVEAPFLRPKKISGSNSSTIDTIKHTLKFFADTYVPDIILILQPTSPFRTSEMIDKSINLLQKSKADSVISVSKVKNHPYKSYWYDKKFLKSFRSDHEKKYYQRQQLPDLFYENGTIYAFWTKTLKKYDSIYGQKIKPLIAKENEIHIDIDDKFDLFISEMILLYWEKYKKNKLKKLNF
jgi:CMP-N-acetylneuraminic acid synthetase